MRNLKKFLALVLAVMMALSLMVTVNAAAATPTDFDDLGSATYTEAIDVLSALGIVKGYADSDDFKPTQNITRAEVAALIYRIAANDAKEAQAGIYKDYNRFGDVDENSWYAGVVNYCANAELVKGDGTNYAPRKNVTGYEILAMALRMLGYDQNNEFTGSGWQIRTASYARKVGLTQNIKEGTLGQPATREVVCEILFRALQADTVSYNMISGYTEDLLVNASSVNATYGGVIYDKNVTNTLMYANYGIVGTRTIYGSDDYGRPVVEWVKDAKDDTVQNGGKFIVNPQKAAQTAANAADNKGVYVGTNAAGVTVNAGASYIPSSTPGATFAAANDYTPANLSTYSKDPDKIDQAEIAITMSPVKTYTGVVDECTLSKDINADRAIPGDKLTEWLNGRLVSARLATDTDSSGTFDDGDEWYKMDALHTREATVNAPGRTLEVYQTVTDNKADSSHTFVFVYIDTLMGVVDKVVPRTFDTNQHVMSDAELHVKINETVTVVDTDDASDFDDYKKGDLVLLTTWGGKSYDVKTNAKVDQNLVAATTRQAYWEAIQSIIPQTEKDFLWFDTNGDKDDANPTADEWAVDVIGKAATETFTIQSTVGARMVKSGVVSTNGKTYPGNVVYLANEVDKDNANDPVYYKGFITVAGDGSITSGSANDTAFDGETTVPSSPTDYGVPMINEKIGKTVTAVLDENGYVVGMTEEASTSDVGVVIGMDTVRVGVGKYAVEAEMLMMDGTTKTVRFLDNDPATATTRGTNGTDGKDANGNVVFDYFKTSSAADASFDTSAGDKSGCRNLQAAEDVLIKIEPFSMDGQTYYHVVETNAGADVVFSAGVADDNNNITTGKADTLKDNAANAVNYNAKPTVTDDNVDDNTKFIIAELDYRYNQGSGNNQGGYEAMIRTAYEGFKNIPSITSANSGILTQRIGNNVYIYPDMTVTNLVYTMSNKQTVPVDETYLVLASVATYANHSTYKVLKDGEIMELDVSNANTGTTQPNKVFEDTLDAGGANYGQLIKIDGKDTRGYVTAASYVDRVIGADDGVFFDNNGVIAIQDDTNNATGATTLAKDNVGSFLTVADNCSVQIVNLLTGTVTPGSLSNIMQYEKFTDAVGDSHAFVYELDDLGYVSHIYILD